MSTVQLRLQLLGQRAVRDGLNATARDMQRLGKRTAAISAAMGAGGVLAQGLAATGLAGVGLVSSLAPVAGLLGALPAAGALAAQGLGVAKFAMAGVTEAVGGLNEKLDPKKLAALTPPARAFAAQLNTWKAPIRDLQSALQRGLLPGLTEGMAAARPAIAALRGPLTGTARVLGGFGARLGKLVGSGGFLADLRSQAQFNNVQLGRLGGAGIHVVGILRSLMVGSRGLVSWLVRLAAGWAKTADSTLAAWRSSGKLAAIFHTVQVTTSRVGRLFWRLGKALFNIGAIGKREIGDGILVSLVRAVTALERWTRSESGIRKITSAFKQAREVLRKVVDFVGRVGKGIGPDALASLRDFSTVMKNVLQGGGGASVLGLYASGLASLAAAAAFITTNVPGASNALGVLFALLILNKVGGINAIGLAIRGIGLACLFIANPLGAVSGAFWALNAAIAANPVGAIVVGLLALGAGLVLAYKKVAWFRNIVDKAWKAIKSAGHWAKVAAGNVRDFLGKAFQWVADKARSLYDKLKPILSVMKKVAEFSPLGLAKKAAGAVGIPGFAKGGTIQRGGMAVVGERGPEAVQLPTGARVFPNGTQAATGGDLSGLIAALHRQSAAYDRLASRPVIVKVGERELLRAHAGALATETAFA